MSEAEVAFWSGRTALADAPTISSLSPNVTEDGGIEHNHRCLHRAVISCGSRYRLGFFLSKLWNTENR